MSRPKGPRWTEEWLAGRLKGQVQKAEVAAVVTNTRPSRMNSTESAYAQILEWERREGKILWFRFEAIKLRLAAKTFLTPDFPVILPDRTLEFREVKGGVMEDDAAVKLKVAAEMYPYFRFIVAWSQKGGGFILKDVADGL